MTLLPFSAMRVHTANGVRFSAALMKLSAPSVHRELPHPGMTPQRRFTTTSATRWSMIMMPPPRKRLLVRHIPSLPFSEAAAEGISSCVRAMPTPSNCCARNSEFPPCMSREWRMVADIAGIMPRWMTTNGMALMPHGMIKKQRCFTPIF